MQTLLDGVLKMHPTEGERRGENCDVTFAKAIHCMFVTVEADEFMVVGNVYLIGELGFDGLVAVVHFLLKNVGHSDQLERHFLSQRVHHCSGATPTTADQSDA